MVVKAKDWDFYIGKIHGGITFYPYQITFGVSLRYFPCLYMPSLRIHFLMFKFFVGIRIKQITKE